MAIKISSLTRQVVLIPELICILHVHEEQRGQLLINKLMIHFLLINIYRDRSVVRGPGPCAPRAPPLTVDEKVGARQARGVGVLIFHNGSAG